MVRYYPPRITFRDIEKLLDGEFGVTDLAEQERLDDVEERKKRGKGAPKKAKSKGALPFSFVLPSEIETDVLTVLYRGQQTCGEEKTMNDTFPAFPSHLDLALDHYGSIGNYSLCSFAYLRRNPIGVVDMRCLFLCSTTYQFVNVTHGSYLDLIFILPNFPQGILVIPGPPQKRIRRRCPSLFITSTLASYTKIQAASLLAL